MASGLVSYDKPNEQRARWLTDEEIEAALCLWEYCLLCRTEDDDDVFDWLRGGEGMAQARGMCVEFAKDIETSYEVATKHGYDDLFDWEFVPRWTRLAMSITQDHLLTAGWINYIGLEISREFRLEH